LDKAVAYARAIGGEPVIQVPLLADNAGQTPTPDTAAAMVTYANVTNGYGIKYFSVGNEPDLYDTQGWPTNMSQPAIPGYTPSDYCTSVRAFVTAMKAVDPTIQIIGPDLSWKYQAGNSQNDWLTPVLTDCGDLFDVISIHRYPFEAAAATLSAAAADPALFRSVINSVFGILHATGQGSKPLALMEMNIVYDATTCVLEASPGTVGSALWLADSVGTAMELGLWTTAVWDFGSYWNAAHSHAAASLLCLFSVRRSLRANAFECDVDASWCERSRESKSSRRRDRGHCNQLEQITGGAVVSGNRARHNASKHDVRAATGLDGGSRDPR
jgi:hypothetical protein